MIDIKLEIIIDKNLEENLIKLYTNSYTEEIKEIEEILNKYKNSSKNILTVFKDEQVFVIDTKDIIRVYSENKHVFIETKNDIYKSRLRLYEIEERLEKNDFIRISRFEIINIKYIEKLDLSFTGTIAVSLKNGKICYVSRRNLKEFKNILGF